MRPRTHVPSVTELHDSPELGVLTLLETGLDIAVLALIAAYPDDEPDAELIPLERRTARGVVSAIGALYAALERYRFALARARADRHVPGSPF